MLQIYQNSMKMYSSKNNWPITTITIGASTGTIGAIAAAAEAVGVAFFGLSMFVVGGVLLLISFAYLASFNRQEALKEIAKEAYDKLSVGLEKTLNDTIRKELKKAFS